VCHHSLHTLLAPFGGCTFIQFSQWSYAWLDESSSCPVPRFPRSQLWAIKAPFGQKTPFLRTARGNSLLFVLAKSVCCSRLILFYLVLCLPSLLFFALRINITGELRENVSYSMNNVAYFASNINYFWYALIL